MVEQCLSDGADLNNEIEDYVSSDYYCTDHFIMFL